MASGSSSPLEEFGDTGVKKKFKPFKAIRGIIRDGKKKVKVPSFLKGQHSLPEEDPETSAVDGHLDRRISLSHDSIFNPEPSKQEIPIRHVPHSAPKPIVTSHSKATRGGPDKNLLSPKSKPIVGSHFQGELNKILNVKQQVRPRNPPDDYSLSTSAPSFIPSSPVKPNPTFQQESLDPQNLENGKETPPVDSSTGMSMTDEKALPELKHGAAYAKINARPKNRKPRRNFRSHTQRNASDGNEFKTFDDASDSFPFHEDITAASCDQKVQIQSKEISQEENHDNEEDLKISQSKIRSTSFGGLTQNDTHETSKKPSTSSDDEIVSKAQNLVDDRPCDSPKQLNIFDKVADKKSTGKQSPSSPKKNFGPKVDKKSKKIGRSRIKSETEASEAATSAKQLMKTFSCDVDKPEAKLPTQEGASKQTNLPRNVKKTPKEESSKKANFKKNPRKSPNSPKDVDGPMPKNLSISEKTGSPLNPVLMESDISTRIQKLKKVSTSHDSIKIDSKEGEVVEQPTKGDDDSPPHEMFSRFSFSKRRSSPENDEPQKKSASKVTDGTDTNVHTSSRTERILQKLRKVSQSDADKQSPDKDKDQPRTEGSLKKVPSRKNPEQNVSASKELPAMDDKPGAVRKDENNQPSALFSVKLRKTVSNKKLVAKGAKDTEKTTKHEKAERKGGKTATDIVETRALVFGQLNAGENRNNNNSLNLDASSLEKARIKNNRYSDCFDQRANVSPTLKKPTIARSASAKVGSKNLSSTNNIPTDEPDPSLLNSSAPSWISLARNRSKRWGKLSVPDPSVEQNPGSEEKSISPSRDVTPIECSGSPASWTSEEGVSEPSSFLRRAANDKAPSAKENQAPGNEQIEKRPLKQSEPPPWLAVAMDKKKRWSYGETV